MRGVTVRGCAVACSRRRAGDGLEVADRGVEGEGLGDGLGERELALCAGPALAGAVAGDLDHVVAGPHAEVEVERGAGGLRIEAERAALPADLDDGAAVDTFGLAGGHGDESIGVLA